MKGTAVLLLLATGTGLWGQIGYPGGYPGSYPGTGGIPIPRRGKRGSAGSDSDARQLTRVSGKLTRIDDKRIVVDVPDGRTVEFLRTAKTKVYRDEGEVNASELKVGDQVAVEGTQAADGVLSAETMRIEASAPDEAAQAPESEPRAATRPAPATTKAPKPARDPGDPGPPVLTRGGPSERKPEPAATTTSSADAAPADTEQSEPEEPDQEPAAAVRDPLIEKARAATASFAEGLPSYVCKEFMARYMSSSRPADWRALDVVSTEVVYQQGKETYRDIQINGKPINKPMEQIGGSWSTGEFASVLLDLFSPSTAAEFHPRGDDTIAGVQARVYNFTVEQANSHWYVQAPSQSIRPAYRGAVWINPRNGRVLRIEMGARGLPEEFPLDTVESAVDYGSLRLGTGEYLLPVHAETLSCQRGTSNCSRNTIDFRNYHKFEADSSVTFDSAKE